MKTTSLQALFSLSLIGSVLLFGAPNYLNAAVALSSTAPDSNTIILGSSAPAASGSLAYSRGSMNDQYGGVAFELTESSSVSGITFLLHAFGNGASGAEVSLSIVKFSNLPEVPSPNPTTDIIYPYTTEYTEVMLLPSLSSGDSGKFITFSLITPVALPAGIYGVVVHFTAVGSKQSINFRSASSNGEAMVGFRTEDTYSGNSITGTTYYVTAHEAYFALEGTAVPEPSMAWLAGLGLLMAGREAWKRRGRAEILS